MIISVHQPQFAPWLGYFAKIADADTFVLLDTVQYKKNEWQNRNKIKTSQGELWLTVPVKYKFGQKIFEVEINNQQDWQKKQQKTLVSTYSKSRFFKEIITLLEMVLTRHWTTIGELNISMVQSIAAYLGIKTPIKVASELPAFPENPDDRLIAITKFFQGSHYLAGSGGHGYMELEKYNDAGVALLFQSYKHPVYPQLYGDFLPYMSILDLLFNCGPESLTILRGAT